MKIRSGVYAQQCLAALLIPALWGCGGPKKAAPAIAENRTPPQATEAAASRADAGLSAPSEPLARILTPAELPEDTFDSYGEEAVLTVRGKEYSALKYCGDAYNEPTIEVFQVKGHEDSVVYLCHSIKNKRTNYVSIFHASDDVKTMSLEPAATSPRISDAKLESTVAQLVAEPAAKSRTTPPSMAELRVACDALQEAHPDHDPFELTTQTHKRPDGPSLLVATCSQKGRQNVLVQVFNVETGHSFLAGGPSCTEVSSDGRYLACNDNSRNSSLIDVQKSLLSPKVRVRGSRLFSSEPSVVTTRGFYLDVIGCAVHNRGRGPAAAVYADCLGNTDGSDMCEFTHWVTANTLEGRWALGGSGPSAGAGVRYNVDTKVYTFPNYSVRVPAASAASILAQAEKDGTYSPLDESFFTKAEARKLGKTLTSQGSTKSFKVVGRKPTQWVYGKEQKRGSDKYYEECCGDE